MIQNSRSTRRVYEDDNWIIEITSNTKQNPTIRISSFKDNHFVDDIELSRQLFEHGLMDVIKDIIYK